MFAQDRTLPADSGTAWRHGPRLGLPCAFCCTGLIAILLVIGVMDLRAMAVVASSSGFRVSSFAFAWPLRAGDSRRETPDSKLETRNCRSCLDYEENLNSF